jgi:hypothetical protein
MKSLPMIFSFSICWLMLIAARVSAQGYDDPLTIQGLDRTTMHSAASRGAGGITIGIANNIGLMFANPASLQSLQGLQFSLGGTQQNSKATQVQQYTPLKYYSNFSLLMEGLTGYIPNPDTSRPGVNAGDTVQRPYDRIGPNWSRSNNRLLPMQAFVAAPFSIAEHKFVVGLGAVEYANVDHFYQNNNVITPSIGSARPLPTPRPSNDSIPVRAQWYQYARSREGSIKGYGMALTSALTERLSFGVSGMILSGSSDDNEQRVGRGRLTFYSNYFRLDSMYLRVNRTGTSDYSGQEFTLSGMYSGRFVSMSVVAKLPTTITREFVTQVRVDTTGSSTTTTVTGKDEIRLPLCGTVGLSIAATENLVLGFEYELRPYASAEYTNAAGAKSNPWLSASAFLAGAQFHAMPWLDLRAGFRTHAEVFEPTGNPIAGEPVTYAVYSGGLGFLFSGIRLNLSYEYALMKYQDIWQTNVNLNNESLHHFAVDASYEIPGIL